MKKYQVLARKYRPQRFQEVVGQETVVATLKNALRFSKIAHAYLFSGSRGTGKTTLARLFAKALNCESLGSDFEPCNQCSSCMDIMAGQSLDVIEIDGASNRGIDDIRQINETLGYAPSHGRYKIYIIDEVHMLTKEAFNALLKTLEEPPEKAKFFFATTEPHKILATVISRCQRFDLGRISLSQIIAKLEQIVQDLGRTIDPDALHKIAELAEGSLRDAQSLLDQILCFLEGHVTASAVRDVFGLVPEEHLFALDAAFSECKPAYAFELVEYLYCAGKDFAHFMEQLIEHYRLLSLYKSLGESAIAPSLAAKYASSARNYTQSQCLYLLEYLLNAEANLQKSLSSRVYLESVLLHVIKAKNRVPVEVLVRRLIELETAIREKTPLAPPPQGLISSYAAEKALEVKQEIPKKEPEISLPPAPQEAPPMIVEAVREKPKIEPVLKEEVTMIDAPSPKIEHSKELKHPSHYDTLMRFAAVELEGSLRT